MLSWAWGWIKDEHGLVNLGTVKPARGGIVFGHRDFSQTACPGQHMMNIIQQLTLTPYQQEDDNMIQILRIGKGDDLSWSPHTFVSDGFSTRHVTDGVAMKELQARGIWPTEEQRISWRALRQLVDDPDQLPRLGF